MLYNFDRVLFCSQYDFDSDVLLHEEFGSDSILTLYPRGIPYEEDTYTHLAMLFPDSGTVMPVTGPGKYEVTSIVAGITNNRM